LKLKDDPESVDSKAPSSKAGQVVKLGVNLTNILQAAFLIKGVRYNFYVPTVCVCNFFVSQKEIISVKLVINCW